MLSPECCKVLVLCSCCCFGRQSGRTEQVILTDGIFKPKEVRSLTYQPPGNTVLCCLVAKSCLTLQPHGLQLSRLLYPWDFPGKKWWRRLPFPSPGDLTNPGIQSPSPALAGGFFTTQPVGKSWHIPKLYKCICILQKSHTQTIIFCFVTSCILFSESLNTNGIVALPKLLSMDSVSTFLHPRVM